MCIIKIRRAPSENEAEAPVVVPIRPISRSQATDPVGQHYYSISASPRSSRPLQQRPQQQQDRHSPRASAGSSSGFIVRQSGSQQQTVIPKPLSPSPRSSRPRIRPGSSYAYGSGPVPTADDGQEPPLSKGSGSGHHRRSHSQRAGAAAAAPMGRRSGSVNYDATSPRQSNVSFRSTREKIVIVDETGRRRESGFH